MSASAMGKLTLYEHRFFPNMRIHKPRWSTSNMVGGGLKFMSSSIPLISRDADE